MSTNIEINLIGGKLLRDDANRRAHLRSEQQDKEHADKTRTALQGTASQPMRGEQPRPRLTPPESAAIPNQNDYNVLLAYFNRPLSNEGSEFRITNASGNYVSWPAENLGTGYTLPANTDTPDLQRINYASAASLSRNTYYFILPISKRACIACWVSGGLNAWQTAEFNRVRTVNNRIPFSRAYNYQTPVTVVAGQTYGGYWITRFTNCPFANDNLSNVPNSYPNEPPDFYNTLDSSYSTYSLTSDIKSSNNVQERVVRCALINGSSIQKITTPPQFYDKAIRMVDTAEAVAAAGELLSPNKNEQENLELWWALTQDTRVTPGQTYARGWDGDFIVSFPARDPDKIWDREPAGRSTRSIGYDYSLTGDSDPLYKDILVPNITEALYKNTNDLNKMLGIHYGLGYSTPATETSHGTTQGFYTPAIYSYLKNTLPIAQNSMRQYGYVRSQLTNAGANPPSKLIVRSTDHATSSNTIDFYQTAIGTSLTIESDLSGATTSKHKQVTYNPSLGFPAIAWDWGQTQYNLAQLSSLGFNNLPI